jgi:hypothetical protein
MGNETTPPGAQRELGMIDQSKVAESLRRESWPFPKSCQTIKLERRPKTKLS